jgi:hypothetical protein
MKIVILSLILSLSASASFYIKNCSTADSYFNSVEGHTNQGLRYRIYDASLKTTKTVEIKNFTQDILSTSIIKEKSSKTCNDSGSGVMSWENLELVTKVIRLKGEELFNATLNGVSQDRKSLKVTLLCETKGNSRASCN